MPSRDCLLGGLILAACLGTFPVHAQPTITNVTVGTAFRYQGALRGVFPNAFAQTGALQFQFGLWDDPASTNAASQMASNILTTLSVSNGFISTMLDFGDVFDGRRAFLEVAVYAPSNTIPASSNWVTVSPRTEIGAVPYAMWALKGGTTILRSAGIYEFSSIYGIATNANSLPYASDDRPVPGRFTVIYYGYSGFPDGVISDFEGLSVAKIVDEARILIGRKHWSAYTGSSPCESCPPCLLCYGNISLEVWSLSNRVATLTSSNGEFHHFSDGIRPQFVRTLGTSTNLVLGTVPTSVWLPLPITNSNSRIGVGEFLRLGWHVPGASTANGDLYIRAEAVVRDTR